MPIRRVRCIEIFLVEVVGHGGVERKKAEIMSSVELSFRHRAFEVFITRSGADVQQAAGYIVEPHVVNIFNVCRLTGSK